MSTTIRRTPPPTTTPTRSSAPPTTPTRSQTAARRIVTNSPAAPAAIPAPAPATRSRARRSATQPVVAPPAAPTRAPARTAVAKRKPATAKATNRAAKKTSAAPARPQRRAPRNAAPAPRGAGNNDGDGVGGNDGDDGGDGDDGDDDDGDDDGDDDEADDAAGDSEDEADRDAAERTSFVDHRAAALAHLPLGGKPNPKHLTIRQFNGRIKPGDFDSGARLWATEFVSQLIGAQLRDGHRWTEPVKCSILLACLAEEAAAWFDRVWASTPDLKVRTALRLLTDKYATKIGEDAIRERIKQARREPTESYEMYAQRLQNMAGALPGGLDVETNAAAALSAFVRTACPAEEKQLRVFETNDKRRRVPSRLTMDELVEFLSLYDRSDGVSKPPKANNQPAAKRAKNDAGKAVESAHAVIADRKRKPAKNSKTSHPLKTEQKSYTPPPWPVTEKTLCYGCRGRGHIASDPACPKFGDRRTKNTPLLDAAIKAVDEDSD